MTSTTSTTSTSNEKYFTRKTRLYDRIGPEFVLVTEGARVVVTLNPDNTTSITVLADAGVKVIKRTRTPAAAAK